MTTSPGVEGETLSAFLRSRWRGEVPLGSLFWRDMVLVGTLVNAAASAAALICLGIGWPLAVTLIVHFVPMPYNLFLFLAVWGTAGRQPGLAATGYQLAAAAWLVLATAA